MTSKVVTAAVPYRDGWGLWVLDAEWDCPGADARCDWPGFDLLGWVNEALGCALGVCLPVWTAGWLGCAGWLGWVGWLGCVGWPGWPAPPLPAPLADG